jgi:hypothetical protein
MLAFGCKKDSASTTVKPTTVETVAPETRAKPAKRSRLVGSIDNSAATLLRYLPRDSSIVMGLNWRQARENEFVRSFDDQLLAAIPQLDGSKAKCGLDPLTDIHSLAVSMGPDPSNSNTMVMAMSGDFTREALEKCVRANGGTVEGSRYSGTTNVYWPMANVVIFSTGQSSEQLALAPSASAWDNDKLMVLVDEVDLQSSFWLAGMVPRFLASSMASMGTAPWGGYSAIDFGVGMRATVGLEFANEDEAKAMLTMLEAGLTMAKGTPTIGELLESVTSGVVGQAVVIVGDFTAEELVQMQMMLKQTLN